MGGFLAASAGKFNGMIFALSCLTTIFLQILSNLANDYGDSVHGADHAERKGPKRAVQSGLISSTQMKMAVIAFSLLSLASGTTLLVVSFGADWNSLLFFFALGLLSIAAAIAYTVGNKPYGYAGLGDISVLIFFGLVGVMGSLYLFTRAIEWSSLLPALTCGLLSIAVLNINNIRDIESDRLAGKYSIPVRIGRQKAIVYQWFLIVTAIVFAAIYVLLNYKSAFQFLFLLSAPLFVRIGMAVSKKSPTELDPYLRQMAVSTLLFVILFGAGNLVQ
jgi:1,4-dihydroxy-2-naphthoate octaprenyltransferase